MRHVYLFMYIFLLTSAVYSARFALLIGSTRGSNEDAELRYVEKDLIAFRSVLSDLCGFDQTNILTLFNCASDQLTDAFNSLNKKISGEKENLLLFYYTGHANERGIKLAEYVYSFADLKAHLSSSGASIQIGILDACQSGTMTTLKGGQLADPFLFSTDSKIKGQVFLSSSSSKEFSLESDALQSSVFSFHLLNALRGSADISGDRKISLSEAYQYAYNHTVSTTARSTNGTQHPGYNFSIQGEGEIVLADLSSKTSGLLIHKSITGIITIFDENNTPVADINKNIPQPVLIALNKGMYTVTRQSSGRMMSCQKQIDQKSILPILENDFDQLSNKWPMRQKGAEYFLQNSSDITLGIHYTRPAFSNLEKELGAVFSHYRYFGINPDFQFSSYLPMVSLSQEFWFYNLFCIIFSAGYSSMNNSAVYNGKRLNSFDNKYYSYTLSVQNQFTLIPISIETGFRIRKGIFKNVSFTAGINHYRIKQTISSTFSDSLYKVTTQSFSQYKSSLNLPSAGIRYQYFFNRHIATGISLKYKYHSHSKENPAFAYNEIPSFNPAEFDISIQCTASLFNDKKD